MELTFYIPDPKIKDGDLVAGVKTVKINPDSVSDSQLAELQISRATLSELANIPVSLDDKIKALESRILILEAKIK
jgi:hypothetical protein